MAIGLLIAAGCSSNDPGADGSGSADSGALCSSTRLEQDMDEALDQISSDVDFSFSIERPDGRRYTYNRGASTLQTAYESASTSKLVTAVIILRLVNQGYLDLSDRPQDFLSDWPIDSSDPLYDMTLSHLLSFTSGLEEEPLCLYSGAFDFESCVANIASRNADSGIAPGQRFYYAGTHLQVAGLMAVKARGAASWQDVFEEFQAATGLFATAAYDVQSLTNPLLAGGMHWTGEQYLDFLSTLSKGELLDAGLMHQLVSDQTATATIAYSPIYNALGEQWHYGYGLWHECRDEIYTCTAGSRVSSPGAFGAYPFWNRELDYIGIVARQGQLGTFPEGIQVERAVRSLVEQWISCQ